VYTDHHDKVDLKNTLAILKKLGINRLMVEGGATLNFELLRLGLVDEVLAYMAPMIFGGASAPTMVAGSGLERSAAIPLKLVHVEKWDDGGVLVKYQLEK
jgi:2,5-diamino-6-(ribosylamino)-4(3H)-pyrimidinone 5'-phosphate reductase